MDIYEEIRRNLLGGKADEVVNLIKKAIAVCYPPESVLKEGLILGVDTLAYKFRGLCAGCPECGPGTECGSQMPDTLSGTRRGKAVHSGHRHCGGGCP